MDFERENAKTEMKDLRHRQTIHEKEVHRTNAGVRMKVRCKRTNGKT